MKKLLLFLLPFLLLAGCGDKQEIIKEDTAQLTYQKQKDCIDYRNDYMEYLNSQYHFTNWITLSELVDRVDNKVYYHLNDIEIFYSEPFDKCIAAYQIFWYHPRDSRHDEYVMYKIDDIFNDDNIYDDTDFQDQEQREYLEHLNAWHKETTYYRTGKTRDELYGVE